MNRKARVTGLAVVVGSLALGIGWLLVRDTPVAREAVVAAAAEREQPGAPAPAAGSVRDLPADVADAPKPWLALESTLAYARRWDRDSTPGPAAFRAWTIRYRAETSDAGRRELEAEGVELARERRAIMRTLIETDPRRALELTVPAAVRQHLPASVLAELEQRVAGTGDYRLASALPMIGSREPEHAWRTAHLAGATYRAFSYGRRQAQFTKIGASLHGIALDGSMAVHDHPLRLLEIGEEPRGGHPQRCAVTGSALAASVPAPSLIEAFGRVIAVSDPALLEAVVQRLVAAEDAPDPRVAPVLRQDGVLGAAVEPLPPTAWTTGVKQVLVVRVDFPDFPGEPITTTDGSTLIDGTVSGYFVAASYGVTSLTATISPTVYRLPQNGALYATTGDYTQLHSDARTLAAANFTLTNFDRIIVAFRNLGSASVPGSQLTWAGLADVGGPNMWVNGAWNFRVTAHELGHTYGLRHANLWQVNDGNPASSSGSSTEYGDPFDIMGASGSSNATYHFNPWFKNRLGWIADASVESVTASGTYRVARFDDAGTSGAVPLALNVFRDGVRSYWIGYRKNFTGTPTLNNGAYTFWGYYSNRQANLLDMTTPGSSASDAGLAIGASFSDTAYGVTIQPMTTGGTAPNQYIDVAVTIARPTQAYPAMWGNDRATDGPFGLFGVQALAGGRNHTLALKSDGTVVAWGANTAGESTVPAGLAGVVAIDAGDDTSGAVRNDGTVVLWGDSSDGQTTAPGGLSGVTRLAIGEEHVLALKSDGTVVAWGGPNTYGETTVPGGLTGVTAIAAGAGVSLALKSDGTVVRWGANYGSPPGGLTGVTKIASGNAHHLALKNDGTLVVWGNGTYGQRDIPAGLTQVVDIAGGGFHSLAVKSDGAVVSWGYNTSGQTNLPAGLPFVSQVSAGYSHSLALVGTAAATVTITDDPDNVSVNEGANAQFAVAATGTAPITYQWQRRPSGGAFTDLSAVAPYSGTTGTTLTITGADVAMSGDQFRCVVTASGTTSAGSAAATLTVNASVPVISSQPLAQSAAAGQGIALSVTAGGSGTITYQWQLNGVDIAGATATTYTIRRGQAFHAGTYRVIVTNVAGSTTSNNAVVTVNAPAASDARLMNISTRGLSLTGSEILIPGFVIQGTGTKRLLLRAVGPTLGAFGVSGTLANPAMVLKKWNPAILPSGAYEDVTSNDNWGTNANAAAIVTASSDVGAFALGAGSADAALLVDLAAGQYSVVASGVGNTTGVAIVEAYDTDAGSPATRLINISNRGFVGAGIDIMIPGFVVSNEGSRTFLIRAVGPTLGAFGVGGTLADPTLDVFERVQGPPAADVLILSNDNWDGIAGSATTASVASAVGAFGLNAGSADAAFVVTLPPGIYTVNARGKNGGTGIALVEVYLVP